MKRRQMRAAVELVVTGALLAVPLIRLLLIIAFLVSGLTSGHVLAGSASPQPAAEKNAAEQTVGETSAGENRQTARDACVKEYGADQETPCNCALDAIDRMFKPGQRAAPYYVLGMTVAQQMDFLLGDEKTTVPLTEDIVFDVTDLMNACTIGITDPAKDK